jgi:hypothetical protein
MTSWCSYQASLWDSEQAARYSRASALHMAATRTRLEADARTRFGRLSAAWKRKTRPG